MLVVVFSLVLLAVSASKEGVDDQRWMHWSVLAAGPLLLLLRIVAMRRLHRLSPRPPARSRARSSVMAVASRIVDGLDPFDVTALFTDPAFYGLLISGACAASSVHHRVAETGSVNGAAAALVVGANGAARCDRYRLPRRHLVRLAWWRSSHSARPVVGGGGARMVRRGDHRRKSRNSTVHVPVA